MAVYLGACADAELVWWNSTPPLQPVNQAVRVENAAGDSTPYGKKSTRRQEAIAPALVYGSQLVT
jgi:hypothetical protein